jgi:hypothetical protein
MSSAAGCGQALIWAIAGWLAGQHRHASRIANRRKRSGTAGMTHLGARPDAAGGKRIRAPRAKPLAIELPSSISKLDRSTSAPVANSRTCTARPRSHDAAVQKQPDKQCDVSATEPAAFMRKDRCGRGAQEKKEPCMFRIVAIAVLTALFSVPAIAQTKGKSGTAPGQNQPTPGHLQTVPGGAKDLAPGREQLAPGAAKDLAPGADKRKQ